MTTSRRRILGALLAAPPALVWAGRVPLARAGEAGLAPTPHCPDDPEATPRQTPGPFYTPEAPRRSDLTGDGAGRCFGLHGFVLDARCRPVADAVVELWHADDDGAYDNRGYRWRAHQISDGAGRWRFDTILPGRYGRRTPHYHFRILRPGGAALITQLYLPDHPHNQRDWLFDPRLVMDLSADEGSGRFDFVLPAG